MDSAIYYKEIFNIEEERRKCVELGKSRKEIIAKFEKEYRKSSSDKDVFTCLCCNKKVVMSLMKSEASPFYFRHHEKSDCAYKDNYKTYQNQINKYEDVVQKNIGITIFEQILKGIFKPKNIEVRRGYYYQKKLSFIPDFILEFPNTKEKWVVDYLTTKNRLKNDNSHKVNLENRIKLYEKEGLKYFLFVDSKWKTINEDDYGTLLPTEMTVSNKDSEDKKWEEFLNEYITIDMWNFMNKEMDSQIDTLDVRNISYIDIDNWILEQYRFLKIWKQNSNQVIYKLSNVNIPLETAFGLNENKDSFALDGNMNKENEKTRFLSALKDKLPKPIKEKKTIEIDKNKKEIKQREKIDRENELDSEDFVPDLGKSKKLVEKVLGIKISNKNKQYISYEDDSWKLVLSEYIEKRPVEYEFVVNKEKILNYLRENAEIIKQPNSIQWIPVNEFLEQYIIMMEKEFGVTIELK